MIGIYFSGTGNTKYCVERFLRGYDENAKAVSIEDTNVLNEISVHKRIVLGYPVQYSCMPKMLKDFIIDNGNCWKGKEIFVIATMAMFSGDGAGVGARLMKKFGAEIIGGLHLKMPDNICDEIVLKLSEEKKKQIIHKTGDKAQEVGVMLKSDKFLREGLGAFDYMAGLLSQRVIFGHKTDKYSDRLKISENKCIGCGKCVALCPMDNISLKEKVAIPSDKCTMCYRCVNACPVQAITLLGHTVVKQYDIRKYVK